ncbi:MAG: hypothetical protein ACLTSZ_04160 [Lachnospiraceae bacterium]
MDAIDMEAIQKQINELTDTGKNLITEAGQMSEVLQKQISAPMQELLAEGQALQTTLEVCRHRFRSWQRRPVHCRK